MLEKKKGEGERAWLVWNGTVEERWRNDGGRKGKEEGKEGRKQSSITLSTCFDRMTLACNNDRDG